MLQPGNGWFYRASVTPLTSHILSQMLGVIVTISLFILAFDLEKKEAYLSIAMKQLKHLSEFVENILAMSMERRKTMSLKPEKIDLPVLVDEIAEAFSQVRRYI